MKVLSFTRILFAALCVYICASSVGAQEGVPPQNTPNATEELDSRAFAVELARWDADLEALKQHPGGARELSARVPPIWRIREKDDQFEVPTKWLRDGLTRIAGSKQPGETQINDLRKRVIALKQEAEAHAAQGEPWVGAEDTLKRILERREFRSIRAPSAFDLWVQRMIRRFQQWLIGLFSRAARYPNVGRAILWTLIGGTVFLLAVMLFRALQREEKREELKLEGPPLPGRTWREWFREAEAAAKTGDFRKAIRAAYWAGVSRLEELGAWTPDRARTPREYLRLLQAQDERRRPLGELTRRFELTWYGYVEATPVEYRETLGQLEVLGCRLPSNPAIAKS